MRLLPNRERLPVGGEAHATKDERIGGFKKRTATITPLALRPNNRKTVGAEREKRENGCVCVRRLKAEHLIKPNEFLGRFGYGGYSVVSISILKKCPPKQ